MASFVHRVTELNVRQLSLASVMTLIAIKTVHRISFGEQFNAIFTADIGLTTLCDFTDHTDR